MATATIASSGSFHAEEILFYVCDRPNLNKCSRCWNKHQNCLASLWIITYLRDKQEGKKPMPDGYWKVVPGELFLIPFERIISLNIVHLHPSEQDASAVLEAATEELGAADTSTDVEPPSEEFSAITKPLSEEYITNSSGERLAWLTHWPDGSWVLTTLMGEPRDYTVVT